MLTPTLVQNELAGFISSIHAFEEKLKKEYPDQVNQDLTDLYYSFTCENQKAYFNLLQNFLKEFVTQYLKAPVTTCTENSIELFGSIFVTSTQYGLMCTDSKTGAEIPRSQLLSYYYFDSTKQNAGNVPTLNALFQTLAACFVRSFLPSQSSDMLLWQVKRTSSQICSSESYTIRDIFKLQGSLSKAIISIIPKTPLYALASKDQYLSLLQFCEGAVKAEKQPEEAQKLLTLGHENYAWQKLFQSKTSLDQLTDFNRDNCINIYGFYSVESFDALFNLADLNVFADITNGLLPVNESDADQHRILLQWLAVSPQYNQINYDEYEHLDYQLSMLPAFHSRLLIERHSAEICHFLDKAMDMIRNQYAQYHTALDIGEEVEKPFADENAELDAFCDFLFRSESSETGQFTMPNLKNEYLELQLSEIIELAC